MAVCGLPTGNALGLAPMPAIVISRGNDGAQMSWGRRLSWATERSLTHTTIWAFEPWAEKV
jgi:hypothetical protein